MEISAATLDDVPQLCELLELLFSQEAEFVPNRAVQAEGLRQILAEPERGQILVLRERDSLLGMVNLLFTVSTALGGRAAIKEAPIPPILLSCCCSCTTTAGATSKPSS